MLPDATILEIQKLLKQDMTYAKITETLKVSANTIAAVARGDRKPRDHPKKKESKRSSSVQCPVCNRISNVTPCVACSAKKFRDNARGR